MEDGKHVLFDCQFFRVVWQQISKGSNWLQILALSFKDLFYSIQAASNKEETDIFDTIVWFIWFARNKLKHEGVRPNEASIALQVLNLIEGFMSLSRNVIYPSITPQVHLKNSGYYLYLEL